MSRVLVTGCSGFIGSHLADYLEPYYEVIGVDKSLPKKSHSYKFIQHDLALSCQDLPDADIVVHLAAYNGTKHFYTRPLEVIKNNIIPTLNLLDRYSTVTRFIYAGTPESTAGATDSFAYSVPTDELCPLVVKDITNPRWSYAGSKALGEQAVALSGLDWTIIRYNNVFGPNQKDHFIPEFIQRAQNGIFELYGWENTRTFMYIDDACEVTKRLMQTDLSKKQIVNVGGTEETTILQVAEYILECLDYKSKEIILHDAPSGSAKRRLPDTSKMQMMVDYQCKYTLRQGIDRLIKDMK